MDNALRKATSGISDFLKLEAAGGLLLMAAAVLALIFSNSPLRHAYDDLLKIPVELRFGSFVIAKPLLLWINDGLMAIFFLLVGLEVKREVIEGGTVHSRASGATCRCRRGWNGSPGTYLCPYKPWKWHGLERLGHSHGH